MSHSTELNHNAKVEFHTLCQQHYVTPKYESVQGGSNHAPVFKTYLTIPSKLAGTPVDIIVEATANKKRDSETICAMSAMKIISAAPQSAASTHAQTSSPEQNSFYIPPIPQPPPPPSTAPPQSTIDAARVKLEQEMSGRSLPQQTYSAYAAPQQQYHTAATRPPLQSVSSASAATVPSSSSSAALPSLYAHNFKEKLIAAAMSETADAAILTTALHDLRTFLGTQNLPLAEITNRSGSDHMPSFTSVIVLPNTIIPSNVADGQEWRVEGTAARKKEAQTRAAMAALRLIRLMSSYQDANGHALKMEE